MTLASVESDKLMAMVSLPVLSPAEVVRRSLPATGETQKAKDRASVSIDSEPRLSCECILCMRVCALTIDEVELALHHHGVVSDDLIVVQECRSGRRRRLLCRCALVAFLDD